VKRLGVIKVFEPTDDTHGAEVTFSTKDSRKSFRLPRPISDKEAPPIAVESFAQNPDHYADLMNRIEKFITDSGSSPA
jgi:hypothetical protein